MLDRLTRPHGVEARIPERPRLGLRHQPNVEALVTRASAPQRLLGHVHADDREARIGELGRQLALAAADVQHAHRLVRGCRRRCRDSPDPVEEEGAPQRKIARLRALERCIVAPGAEPGHARAFFIAGGRVAAERALPPGGGAHLEIEAGLAAARRALVSDTQGDLDELHLVGTFLRKPGPELAIVPLEKDAILAGARRVATPAAVRRSRVPVSDTETGPDEPRLF